MAESEKLSRYVDLASRLESSDEVQARQRSVDRREQLNNLDWRTDRKEGLLYAVDTGPRTVGEHLLNKLINGTLPQVRCRADVASAMVEYQAQNLLDAVAPESFNFDAEQIRKLARDAADRKEQAVAGLLAGIEEQQGFGLLQALARNAMMGYAGPVRVLYDATAAAEPGVVPLYIQVLDPRAYFYQPDDRAGYGPKLVIYKRQATLEQLRYEGWSLDVDETDGPSSTLTIYDCWEKERTNKSLKLWHSIIASGGKQGGDHFVKKPTDLFKTRNISRIPYVWRPVNPPAYLHESYPESSSSSMLDSFDKNWELSNLTISLMAQMMALAVDPPKVQQVFSPVTADLVTPGADTIVQPGENIIIPRREFAEQNMDLVKKAIDTATQRAAFPAADYGEGANSMSALMTGRLQQAGNSATNLTRNAISLAYADVLNLIAMYCPIYLQSAQMNVAMGSEVHLFNARLFSGSERFAVTISGMSPLEEAQAAAQWRQLSETDAKGGRFISRETAREKSQVIPWEHIESERITREEEHEIEVERRKAMRENMLAQASAQVEAQINAQREMQAFHQQQAQQMGVPQGGPESDPAQQAQGVAQSPLQAAQDPNAQPFDPSQFVPAGV